MKMFSRLVPTLGARVTLRLTRVYVKGFIKNNNLKKRRVLQCYSGNAEVHHLGMPRVYLRGRWKNKNLKKRCALYRFLNKAGMQ